MSRPRNCGLAVHVEDAGAHAVVDAVHLDVTLSRAADVEAAAEEHAGRRRDIHAAGKRHVVGLGLAALLPPAAHAARREGRAVEPVHDVGAVRHHVSGRAVDAGAVLPPRGRDDALLRHRALGAEEDVGLVELVDQPHGDQQQAGPHAEILVRQPVDVGELDEYLLRVLDLDFRVEDELVVEAVPGVQDGAQIVELRRLA